MAPMRAPHAQSGTSKLAKFVLEEEVAASMTVEENRTRQRRPSSGRERPAQPAVRPPVARRFRRAPPARTAVGLGWPRRRPRGGRGPWARRAIRTAGARSRPEARTGTAAHRRAPRGGGLGRGRTGPEDPDAGQAVGGPGDAGVAGVEPGSQLGCQVADRPRGERSAARRSPGPAAPAWSAAPLVVDQRHVLGRAARTRRPRARARPPRTRWRIPGGCSTQSPAWSTNGGPWSS